MKRFALAISIFAVSTIGAVAADLPTKAPASVVSAIYDWSGFYVGVNGGGGSAHSCWSTSFNGVIVNPALAEGCHNSTGGTVGGQVGYRTQMNNFVFGVEAQGNWANLKGNNLNPVSIFVPLTDQTKIEAFGLFTGQVGYAVNNVLLYAKGGAAVGSERYNNVSLVAGAVFTPGVPTSGGTETRWGAVVGVGMELGFAPSWSVGIEYDRLFMGTNSVTLNLIPPAGVGISGIHNISQDVDIATVRLNYRFGGPVVARY
jgi:outer membrane immunogenic protein